MGLELYAIWSSRLGDMVEKVQHMQTGTVSIASGIRLPLTDLLDT